MNIDAFLATAQVWPDLRIA